MPLLIAAAAAVLSQSKPAFSQTVYQSAHWTKYEYMIPMRDGVRLCCEVYTPKDKPGKHPILMERTPYSAGPYGDAFPDSFPARYASQGYIFAYEDVRGKFMSEGTFDDIRPQSASHSLPTETDESTDAADTVKFLITHVPNNNGHVGLTGISYPGFYAEMGAINTVPGLAASSPQAPVSAWFKGDDWHHNGVLFLQDAFDFMSWFGTVDTKPSPNHEGIDVSKGSLSAYDFFLKVGAMPNFDKEYYKGRIPFWNQVLAHETFDGFWKARAAGPQLKNITCPLLFVGGLFDAEDMYGALHSYEAAKKQNPKTPVYLVMGPWYHGMWAWGPGSSFGDLAYGQPTSSWCRTNVEAPFFNRYLEADPKASKLAPVTIYETGANQWRKFEQWPPRGVTDRALYVGPDHSVTLDNPAGSGKYQYVNDPAHPTPYIGDWQTSKQRPAEYMLADQRWAATRPDVVTIESAPLTKDTVMAGPLDVKLWAAVSGTDADFVVKVIDVYPSDTKDVSPDGESMAGYELMVRGDIMRAKFRKSFSNPSPMVPGKPTLVPFTMNSVFHDFRKGHRIMIQIQSDWFPLCNRNPNVFTDINTASDSAYQKATISILYGKEYPSQIDFKQLGSKPGEDEGQP